MHPPPPPTTRHPALLHPTEHQPKRKTLAKICLADRGRGFQDQIQRINTKCLLIRPSRKDEGGGGGWGVEDESETQRKRRQKRREKKKTPDQRVLIQKSRLIRKIPRQVAMETR